MSQTLLPLVVAKPIEPRKTWEGFNTPHDLALLIASFLAVDPTKFAALQEIVFSDSQPTGEDGNKIWIKTNPPVGIGLPSGDTYDMIYQYQANTPFLLVYDELPYYLRKLSESELADYGLSDPDSKKAKWVIFEP